MQECPHCKSKEITKQGELFSSPSGRLYQEYRCKKCGIEFAVSQGGV